MQSPSRRVIAVSLGAVVVLAAAGGVFAAATGGGGSGRSAVLEAAAAPVTQSTSDAALPPSPDGTTPPMDATPPTTASPTSATAVSTPAASTPSTPTQIAPPTSAAPPPTSAAPPPTYVAPPPTTRPVAPPTHPTGVKFTVINESPDPYKVTIDNIYSTQLPGGQTEVTYVPAPNNPPDHPTGNGGISLTTGQGCGAGDSLDVQATDTYTVRILMPHITKPPCGMSPPPGYKYPFTVTDDRTGVVVNG
jgi:hypothetical protein